MARKKKFDYFEAFERVGKYALDYSEEIVRFLEGHFDEKKGVGHVEPKEVLEHLSELHKIEESSDEVVHDVTARLVDEFMTPIEREDILELIHELDDIVDELDDVLQRMYMYNVSIITAELVEMAHVVRDTTEAVKKACKRLANYKKAKTIKEFIVQIHDFEDTGDKTYIRSVHNIYVRAADNEFDNQLVAHGLAGVLQAFERCCDACETAGDTIVTVVLKNN